MTKDRVLELLTAPTVSISTAGKACGISKDAAYAAADRGEIPTLKFGARRRVPTEPLKKMLGLVAA